MNHGTGPDRPIVQPQACGSNAVQWFLDRGYAVILPLRRGFGATGGAYAEGLAGGVFNSKYCNHINRYQQGIEDARDVAATIDYATALPGIAPDHAVVIGASTGGFTATAYNSIPHPKVDAVISVSGGIGGMLGGVIGGVCGANRLVDAMARFGATASTPMLWIYANNDPLFSPDLTRAMQAAFTKAGGKVDYVNVGAWSSNGHSLFATPDGTAQWGPPVERYLAQHQPG